MKVKYFEHYWNEADFISLTPVFKNAEMVWYLVFIDNEGKTDYFWTEDLNNIIIYEQI